MSEYNESHTPAFRSLVDYFEARDWHFELDPDQPLLRSGFRGKSSANFSAVAMISNDDSLLQFIVHLPLNAPPDRRSDIAEALARANWNMKIGKFEMDFEDGELRFQTYSLFADGELSDSVIREVIEMGLSFADHYMYAIAAVMFDFKSPEEAIDEAEFNLAGRLRDRPQAELDQLLEALHAELTDGDDEDDDEGQLEDEDDATGHR